MESHPAKPAKSFIDAIETQYGHGTPAANASIAMAELIAGLQMKNTELFIPGQAGSLHTIGIKCEAPVNVRKYIVPILSHKLTVDVKITIYRTKIHLIVEYADDEPTAKSARVENNKENAERFQRHHDTKFPTTKLLLSDDKWRKANDIYKNLASMPRKSIKTFVIFDDDINTQAPAGKLQFSLDCKLNTFMKLGSNGTTDSIFESFSGNEIEKLLLHQCVKEIDFNVSNIEKVYSITFVFRCKRNKDQDESTNDKQTEEEKDSDDERATKRIRMWRKPTFL